MASDCTPKPGTFRAFAHMINREVGILWVFGVASCRRAATRASFGRPCRKGSILPS